MIFATDLDPIYKADMTLEIPSSIGTSQFHNLRLRILKVLERSLQVLPVIIRISKAHPTVDVRIEEGINVVLVYMAGPHGDK